MPCIKQQALQKHRRALMFLATIPSKNCRASQSMTKLTPARASNCFFEKMNSEILPNSRLVELPFHPQTSPSQRNPVSVIAPCMSHLFAVKSMLI